MSSSAALWRARFSCVSAAFTSSTIFSSAWPSAMITTDFLVRSASATTRSSLMASSCSATVRSTTMRSRITSAMAFFCTSTALSFSMRCRVTSFSRSTISRSRARVTFSSSMATARLRLFSATSFSRCTFSCCTETDCSAMRRAVSDLVRSSDWILEVSASSRARTLAISRCWRAVASACWRSSSSNASCVSTFFFLICISSLRRSSLVRTCSTAVSSVIFLMPCASRMLLASSSDSGVCSR
ncbi:hypothetical protein D3C72_1437830 [compost metagenome]